MSRIHTLPMGTLHPVRPVLPVAPEVDRRIIFAPALQHVPPVERSRWSDTGERIYAEAVQVIRQANRMARAPRFMGYGRPAQNNAGQP